MAWTVKNSLNRWCLRTLREGTESHLHNFLYEKAGLQLLQHSRCKGRPPLQNACIGDNCQLWNSLSIEHGFCQHRQALKDDLRKIPEESL